MAKYFCNNCGHTFFINVYRQFGPSRECPECKSLWTEYVGPGLEPPEEK